MPSPSSLLIALSFLAAFGGLLYTFLRRHRAGFFPGVSSLVPVGLHAALLAPDVPAGGSPGRTRGSSNTPFTPRAAGELILVVDDESSVRDLLNTVLLNHGYQVVVARDGVEGLTLFSAQADRIALVLTDLHMPNSSGQSFTDLIRAIRPNTKILFMSGMESPESGPEPSPVRSGDPFLLKPFKPAALLEKIHRLLHPDDTAKA
jgi:two-component system cell cycle sensor histidine kinase/response regulator CckA